jgi:hypothetical protein
MDKVQNPSDSVSKSKSIRVHSVISQKIVSCMRHILPSMNLSTGFKRNRTKGTYPLLVNNKILKSISTLLKYG